MKYVVDSNRLRDEELSKFLRISPENLAVLPDYAAMEALKGDPVVGLFESMKVLERFPCQVQILKTTMVVCSLGGSSHGLQRRLVDVPRTREFGIFCRNLALAHAGNTPLVSQLQKLGIESRAHMARVEEDARGFAATSVEAARIFTTEERMQILAPEPLPPELHRKLLLQVMNLSAVVFEQHPAVKQLPSSAELINTYIFRSSLCHLLLGFEYASFGGVPGKAATRIRND
ncbi:MAG: hypothetical protein IV107_03215, partial [Paucibacter sp.]|nr:hypothetical protein [Roseateles sp.]